MGIKRLAKEQRLLALDLKDGKVTFKTNTVPVGVVTQPFEPAIVTADVLTEILQESRTLASLTLPENILPAHLDELLTNGNGFNGSQPRINLIHYEGPNVTPKMKKFIQHNIAQISGALTDLRVDREAPNMEAIDTAFEKLAKHAPALEFMLREPVNIKEKPAHLDIMDRALTAYGKAADAMATGNPTKQPRPDDGKLDEAAVKLAGGELRGNPMSLGGITTGKFDWRPGKPTESVA
ncbi:MAG: hypothetical protein EBR02_02975 [Alphaproteobacteria bacterium]|nr:hypothetical protein [Alphaproteobacteria bacterium]